MEHIDLSGLKGSAIVDVTEFTRLVRENNQLKTKLSLIQDYTRFARFGTRQTYLRLIRKLSK